MAAMIELDETGLDGIGKARQFISFLLTDIETIKVTNEMALNRVGELFATAKNLEDLIEKQRKEANAPDQQRIKARNAKAEEFVAPLKEIQRMANEKTTAYHKALEDGRRREQASLMQAAALLDIGDEDMPMLDLPQEPLKTQAATTATRTVRKWKIKDETLIPLTFYKIDEEKIDKVIKAGVEIPGIETYEETTTYMKRR